MTPSLLQRRPSFTFPLLAAYLLLLIAGVIIPSDGSHHFLHIKSLAFVLTSLLLLFYLATRKALRSSQIPLLLLTILLFAFCSFWLLLGVVKTSTLLPAQVEHFKVLLITVLFPLYTLYLISEHILTPQQMIKTVLLANFAYSLTKLIVVFLVLLSIGNVWTAVSAWGFRIMSMGIHGNLFRLQTSVDILTPFLVPFVLHAETLGISLNSRFRTAFLLISAFSIFVSFSRFLIAAFLFALFLQWFLLRRTKKILTAGIAIACTLILLGSVGTETAGQVINKRFASYASKESDLVRKEQIDALIETFTQSPYMGQGLGGHSPKVIRDERLPYSYEVQWVAMLMQFGLIGLSFLLFSLLLVALPLYFPRISKESALFLGLFLVWLIGGFTNPYLLSLTSGIVYTLFHLAGKELKTKTHCNHLQ